MRISIVIVALNEEAWIGDCIVSCRSDNKRRRFNGGDEIIVVDNGSTDSTAAVARYYGAKVVSEPQRGITHARQRGYHAATGDIIVFLDADTRMPSTWHRHVMREFDDPKVVAVSGPIRYYDVSRLSRVFITLFNLNTWLTVRCGAPMIQGGNFTVRRDALDAVGGFDRSIDFYGEDADIARRLAKVGRIRWRWRCYMTASGRRFAGEGLVRTGLTYALNYLSIMWRKRPLTLTHRDFR